MQVEFQMTLEEFTEAQRVHHQPIPAREQKATIGAMVSLAAIGLAVAGYCAGEQLWGPDAHPGRRAGPLLSYVVLPLFPWIMILGSNIVLVWRRRERLSRKPWEGKRVIGSRAGRWRGLIMSLPAIWAMNLLAYLGFFLFGQYTKDPDSGAIIPAAALDGLWAVPMIYWAVHQFWALAVIRISKSHAIADGWELQTQLHRPLRMEFTAQGAVIETPFSQSRHTWEDFPGARETPMLFLLYISPAQFHLVPKRAFASQEDLEGFRIMVRHLLGPRPSAFPVMPISPMQLPTPIAEEN